MPLDERIQERYRENGPNLQYTQHWWLSNPHYVALFSLIIAELAIRYPNHLLIGEASKKPLTPDMAGKFSILPYSLFLIASLIDDVKYNPFPIDNTPRTEFLKHYPSTIPLLTTIVTAPIALTQGNLEDLVAIGTSAALISNSISHSASIVDQQPHSFTDRIFKRPYIAASIGALSSLLFRPTLERLIEHSESISSFYQQLSQPFKLVLMASTGVAIGTFANNYLASLTQSSSVRSIKHGIKTWWYKLTRQYDKAIEEQEKQLDIDCSQNSRIRQHTNIALLYSKTGDPDKTKHHYKKALELHFQPQPYRNFFDLIRDLAPVKAVRRLISYYTSFFSKNPYTKLTHSINTLDYFPRESLKTVEYLTEQFDKDLELKYLYGILLAVIGETREAEIKIQETLEALVKSKDYKKEETGESKHRVVRLRNPFWNKILVVKYAPLEETHRLEFERKFTCFQAEDQEPEEQSCIPLGVFHDTRTAYYVIEYEDGPLLADKIRDKTATGEDFQRAFNYMTKIHNSFPLEEVLEEERNLTQNLTERLGILPEKLRETILTNLEPVIQSLTQTRRVARIDAHPWNWIITQDRIVRLDTENTRIIPSVYDWVNLLDHTDYLTPEQKLEIIQTTNPSQKEVLAYYNAVCARTLELLEPLSRRSPERDLRKDQIKNSLTALRLIRTNHPDYYDRFQTQYQHLEQAFEELREVA